MKHIGRQNRYEGLIGVKVAEEHSFETKEKDEGAVLIYFTHD